MGGKPALIHQSEVGSLLDLPKEWGERSPTIPIVISVYVKGGGTCTMTFVWISEQSKGVNSLLPPRGFQGSNSGCQALQQVLLPSPVSSLTGPTIRFN